MTLGRTLEKRATDLLADVVWVMSPKVLTSRHSAGIQAVGGCDYAESSREAKSAIALTTFLWLCQPCQVHDVGHATLVGVSDEQNQGIALPACCRWVHGSGHGCSARGACQRLGDT